ncbi:MAG: hypothetical protein KC731_35155 [Myxococcales bacterium]|nr:hypothetical protein [Myxococcales bacterium]
MRDQVVLALLVLSFATLATTHVVIGVRLIWRERPRYRGLLALVVPPLAPVWAYRARWRVLAATWILAVVAYATLVAVARA